jgi:hypothetical protein
VFDAEEQVKPFAPVWDILVVLSPDLRGLTFPWGLPIILPRQNEGCDTTSEHHRGRIKRMMQNSCMIYDLHNTQWTLPLVYFPAF